MKGKSKIVIFIILNVLFILVTIWSVMIYTSLMSEKLPWYEPCGMQFLVILVFSCPVYILIGIMLRILGKFITISKRVKMLPFLCCLGLGLPILIDGGLGLGMQITGTLIGLLTIFVTISFVILDLILMSKKKI